MPRRCDTWSSIRGRVRPVSKSFEELDFQNTPLGELSLRRRRLPNLDGREVFEVKLNEEFLMSSLFHAAEDALSDLGLAAIEGSELDVVVGGLGLGYTAVAALKHTKVRSLRVVEIMAPVISWHRKGLVPEGPTLTSDPRCQFVQGDFFAMTAANGGGFAPEEPNKLFHAVLLDIDHTPGHWLHPSHADFYSVEGLTQLANRIHPGGVFALWSDDFPEEAFLTRLAEVFDRCQAHVVRFPNPLIGGESTNSVYVAHRK